MRGSSLVLPANVLQVKLASGGGGRHRIVIYTAKSVDWPDVKSVEGLRDELVKRIEGINLTSVTTPMSARKGCNLLLEISLQGIDERKANWFTFEVQQMVKSHPRMAVAKQASPRKGRSLQYANHRVRVAIAATS